MVLADGRVVGDAVRDLKTMDNMDHRPEIRAALEGKVGIDQRRAGDQDLMYLAVPVVEQGQAVAVVRTAMAMGPIRQAMSMVYFKVGLGSLGIILLAAGLSLVLSRRLDQAPGGVSPGGRALRPGGLEPETPPPGPGGAGEPGGDHEPHGFPAG